MSFAIQCQMLSRWTRESVNEWNTLPAHTNYETEELALQVIKGWRKDRSDSDLRKNKNVYRVVEEKKDES